jgi:uncharacterized membrane protein
VVDRLTQIVVEESYGGPIPHPHHFAEFEQVCPGSADRILKMAELQQEHVIQMEERAQVDEAADRQRGMYLGFLGLIALIGAGMWCVVNGQALAAGGFLGVGALGTIGHFIGGRQNVKRQ